MKPDKTAQRIVSEAIELPPPLRVFIAEELIKSLDAPASPQLSAKWKREIRRRCAELARGAKLSDAENVFARAHKSLSALMTADYLDEHARSCRRVKFERAMGKVKAIGNPRCRSYFVCAGDRAT